jgi:hypothetical protein
MIHGTVEINTIPLPAHQDGLVIPLLENVLWPIQEMDLEVNQLVKTSAFHISQSLTNIDAILQPTPATNAKRVILDVIMIDQSHAVTA